MPMHALSAVEARITALEQLLRGFTVRGTYDPNQAYQRLDVVACDGSSLVARCDNPGPCPGSNWQLLASRGKRGPRGRGGHCMVDEDDVHAFEVELAAFHGEAAKLRAHMARVKADFDQHMAASRQRFDDDVRAEYARLSAELNAARAELHAEMTRARAELAAEFRSAHARLDRLRPLIAMAEEDDAAASPPHRS
jgi:hypothetical protein